MNKAQLVRRIADELNASQASTKPVVEQILQQIHIALSEGEKIFLPQFGTFELRYHLAKTGRHPQTGEAIEIDGYNQPSFKASTTLKLQINR
ncbi:HU family DNA-binding protein [Shewanella glacialipiscicola]|uniref:HU family DNA-binding protein n=1 Tax=Shewanella glacialipiscicola TaxID=614069 RepID=UPI0021DB146F|nr:HU family DNA-binding protein [Shewanella glacialipiscicola]MCU7996223.1 HU family DNA-binding protein [Shewanella glacialipiscicola]MCU8027537.1 HU family DNA-binding protein [Shewanella glacialipiscicola]